jgi:hypothetical protein
LALSHGRPLFQKNQNGGQVRNGGQWNILCLISRELALKDAPKQDSTFIQKSPEQKSYRSGVIGGLAKSRKKKVKKIDL